MTGELPSLKTLFANYVPARTRQKNCGLSIFMGSSGRHILLNIFWLLNQYKSKCELKTVVSRNVQSGLNVVSEMVQRTFNDHGYGDGGQFKVPKLVKLGCGWLDHRFMTFVSLNFKICNQSDFRRMHFLCKSKFWEFEIFPHCTF